MFTGLIESLGTVVRLDAIPAGWRVGVRTTLAPDLQLGDSLSVDGVCLTVVANTDGVVSADIGPETARVTTLGGLREGHAVNLERAARADTRLGGHLVQGHVDTTASIDRVEAEGDAHWIGVQLPPSVSRLVVPKGSVAVSGVSLTVAHLHADRFEVMIIPFTWEHTNLSSLRVGDPVNLECDMVGKYVARAVDAFAEGIKDRWRSQA
jgi:riboflavin synthase